MLDNTQTVSHLDIPPVEDVARVERWRLREVAKRYSIRKRCRNCGNVLGRAVAVQKLATGEGAVGGLESCASVWVCPVCSAKISAFRQSEANAVIERAKETGKFVSMLTLTQQHNKGHRLAELWEALSKAWNNVASGKRYQTWREGIGFIGYMRAVEVTRSAVYGWHVHTHIVIISDNDPSKSQIEITRGKNKGIYSAYEYVSQIWKSKLKDLGIGFSAEFGGDWTVSKPGDDTYLGFYINKVARVALDKEVTLGAFKKGKRASRTPFEILRDIALYSDPNDIAIWREWQEVSFGKRQLLWSRGLREWAGLVQEELTDEEIINQDTERETLFFISRDDWQFLLESGIGALLLGHNDTLSAVALLDRFGIPIYFSVDDVPEYDRKHIKRKYKEKIKKGNNNGK